MKTIDQRSPDFLCFAGDIVKETKFLAEALESVQAIKAPLSGIAVIRDAWSHTSVLRLQT